MQRIPTSARRGADQPQTSSRVLAHFVAASAFLVAAWLSNPLQLAAQTSGIWSSQSGGVWSNPANWQSENVANGTGAVADFSRLTMTSDITVDLDSSRTVGSLIFGDQGNVHNWTLDNNGDSDNVLTLTNSSTPPLTTAGMASIAVNNGTATISAELTGTEGLVVNPGGQTGTLVLAGPNTFSSYPAPNYGIGAITVDGGTLSIDGDAPPGTGTTSNSTPEPLGYLPPASDGIGTAAWVDYADILLNGGTLEATATFQLNSFRGIVIGSASGGGGGGIDVAAGNVLTYGLTVINVSGLGNVDANGVISDTNIGSSLILSGGGTLYLTSSNNYTGATYINNSGTTLEAGIADVITRLSSVSVASGATFWLNGYSQYVGSLAGAGSVTDNASTGTNVSLWIGGDNTSPTFSGVLSNTTNTFADIISQFIKGGTGNQTLSTSSSATWSTGAGGGYDLAGPSTGMAPTLAVVGGTLTLDLSQASTQVDLINPYYGLQLGGGEIDLNMPSGGTGSSQTFNGTAILTGQSNITVTTNGATSATGINLGQITRSTGGTVDFNPGPSSNGPITTTNGATSFLGGWATVAGTNWAGVNAGGDIVALTSAGGSYTNDAWSGGNNTTVTTSSSPAAGSSTNSLRFNSAGPSAGGFTVTLSGDNTIASGGILVTSAAGANGAAIAGSGTLTSGNGTDLIVNQFDGAGTLTISAPITGSIGVTMSGPGAVALTAASSYTGPTVVNGGTLEVGSEGSAAGSPAPLGTIPGTATPGDIVIDGGTLEFRGAPGTTVTLNSDRGIALGPSVGFGNATIDVPAANVATVPGVITNDGSSISSLTKTGPGTLFITGKNSVSTGFSGGTYINQGTVVISSYTALGDYLSNSTATVTSSDRVLTFTGNATLEALGGTGGKSPGYFSINSGVNATLDMATYASGSNTSEWLFNNGVKGSGNLNLVSSIGSTNPGVYFDDEQSSGYYSTYSGATTIYATDFFTAWDNTNGAYDIAVLNPNGVLNLGGTLQLNNYGTPSPLGGGGSSGTPILSQYVNLVDDTSANLAGWIEGGAGIQTQGGNVIYLNSPNAAQAIVRGTGSTLDLDSIWTQAGLNGQGTPTDQYYVSNNALSNTNGIIGGWCTYNETDWATVNATTGQITALAGGAYTNDTWAPGDNTAVTLNSNSVPAGSTTNTLRFVSLTTTSGASRNQTVTLSGLNVIQSGGILVTTNSSISESAGTTTSGTENSTFTIAGGQLTSGNGTDLIVNQFNLLAGSSLTIASQIVDNGGSHIGLTLGGSTIDGNAVGAGAGGTLILTNSANSYSGATAINASTILQAGALNVIPANSAVIISMLGTLNMNGFSQSIGSLANFDQTLGTLAGVNYGYGTSVVGNGTVMLTVGGDNTSTTFNGGLKNGTGVLALDKVGSGTLTLGNFDDNTTQTANANLQLSNYSGGTTITGGTLDIMYDAELGAVPATPTTNITFNGASGTPTLQFDAAYFGTSLSTNRSIVVAANSIGYVNTNGNALVTYAGLLTVNGGGTFGKGGAGTFELDAPPNLAAGSFLSVTGGTLRLNYASAPTIGGTVNAAVSSGATLDLARATAQLSQMVNVNNAGTLLVSSSAPQSIGAVTGGGNTVVNSGGNLTAYQIRQNSLTISGNATVTLSPSGSGSVGNPTGPNNTTYSSNVTTLSIGGALNAWTGTLDIGNNGLVIQYGSGTDPFTTIENMVESGYAGGDWAGKGITSSLAAAATSSNHPLNIGLEDFTPGKGVFANETSIVFEGQTITTNAVLVRLTYMDDLVLAGDMSQDDATDDALLFAANYGVGTTWSVGDITHDGSINSNDALLFAANYGVGFVSLDGTTGNAIALGGDMAAPEPSGILLGALGALGLGLLLARSRRRWPAAATSC